MLLLLLIFFYTLKRFTKGNYSYQNTALRLRHLKAINSSFVLIFRQVKWNNFCLRTDICKMKFSVIRRIHFECPSYLRPWLQFHLFIRLYKHNTLVCKVQYARGILLILHAIQFWFTRVEHARVRAICAGNIANFACNTILIYARGARARPPLVQRASSQSHTRSLCFNFFRVSAIKRCVMKLKIHGIDNLIFSRND